MSMLMGYLWSVVYEHIFGCYVNFLYVLYGM